MSHAGNWMEPTFEQVPAASGLGPSCSVGYAVRLPGRAAACAAAPLRRQVADAPDRTTARLLPTLGGVEPVNDNAPSADRILCRGRAGEQVAPPRASVSDGRQPTERGSQGRRWGRPGYKPGWGLDPHRLLPVAPTNLGQRTVSCASLAWRALWLLADVPMLPGCGTSPVGAIGPNFGGTLGRCRSVLGSATPSEEPVRPGGAGAVGGAWPPTGWAAPVLR